MLPATRALSASHRRWRRSGTTRPEGRSAETPIELHPEKPASTAADGAPRPTTKALAPLGARSPRARTTTGRQPPLRGGPPLRYGPAGDCLSPFVREFPTGHPEDAPGSTPHSDPVSDRSAVAGDSQTYFRPCTGCLREGAKSYGKDADGNYLAVYPPRGAAENGPRLSAGGNFVVESRGGA